MIDLTNGVTSLLLLFTSQENELKLKEKIIINKEYINKNLDNLVKDTDLSKVIL